jgi:cytochrome c biogenesis protein CcdA
MFLLTSVATLPKIIIAKLSPCILKNIPIVTIGLQQLQLTTTNDRNISCCKEPTNRHSVFSLVFTNVIYIFQSLTFVSRNPS